MERLTIRNSDGLVSQPTATTIQAVFEKLAAYEDTGLTPEEIKQAKHLVLDALDLFGFVEDIIIAHDEGRLVVLPCKVGDVVYALDRRIMQVYRIIPPSAAFIMSEIENGVEFYKTREEAEKALKGVSEDA